PNNVNFCEIELDEGYEPEVEEEEAFVIFVTCHEPYTTKRLVACHSKRLEDKVEEQYRFILLRSEPPVEPLVIVDLLIVLPAVMNLSHPYQKPQNNPVIAVLDSGAVVSIMSNKMMKLQLKITEPSTTTVVTANNAHVRALEKIVNVKLVLEGIMVPTTFQIIESKDETLLLGMDWFK
ncbi:9528_t:CDS:2, partial [Cetraspora pellucida]